MGAIIQAWRLTRRREGDSNTEKTAPSDANDQAQSTEKAATIAIESAPMPVSVSAPIGAQKPEPSDADLERAIVAAMLDGRGAVAELLAERLRGRRHTRAGNVVALAERERKG
jgi:hypothetical protein